MDQDQSQGQHNNSPVNLQNARLVSQLGRILARATLTSSPLGWVVLGTIFMIGIIVFTIVLGTPGQTSEAPQATPSVSTVSGPIPSNNITKWASQISDALQPFEKPCETPSGPIYIFNSMLQIITNGSYTALKRPGSDCGLASSTYFCTDLVIDAYNLAGIKNNFSEGVIRMINDWSSLGLTVQKNNNVSSLRSGDVIFWLDNENNPSPDNTHVDIVNRIDVDENGNGRLTTLDANVNDKSITFNVRGWALIGLGTWQNGVHSIPWYGLAPR